MRSGGDPARRPAGRVGTLAELRHLSALTVEATFADTPPTVDAVAGVSDVMVPGGGSPARSGSDRAATRRAVGGRAADLLSREPSLEELFLALYGGSDHGQATDGR